MRSRSRLAPEYRPDHDAGCPLVQIEVPGNWETQGHSFPIYTNFQYPWPVTAPWVPADNPTGCYRRSFTVPSDWPRDRCHAMSHGTGWMSMQQGAFSTLGLRQAAPHQGGRAALLNILSGLHKLGGLDVKATSLLACQ